MPSDLILNEVSAVQIRDELASGSLSAVELANACIARVEERESEIAAWAWFDPSYFLREAEKADLHRRSGAELGPLHGLPVAVKDIVDTAAIPTENGCAVDAGRVPTEDAAIVSRLKAAGAVIMGKTVTTELAFLSPSKTRNPANVSHTPGGSSSGSAAAVAAGMVPLAIGTQTGGSVIRPASFCGVTGFKPQFGAIPTSGVLVQSSSLDTIGVFAHDPDGAALLASVLMGDRGDTLLGSVGQNSKGDREPIFGFVALPGFDAADVSVKEGIETLRDNIVARVVDVTWPTAFGDAAQRRATINAAEMAYYFQRYYACGAGLLKLETREEIELGQTIPASDYVAARAYQASLQQETERLFSQCDVLMCPAAPGPAPKGLSSTGDSIFNGVWTMSGVPAITLPLLSDRKGMPIGLQLIARANDETGLMKAARWLWCALSHNNA